MRGRRKEAAIAVLPETASKIAKGKEQKRHPSQSASSKNDMRMQKFWKNRKFLDLDVVFREMCKEKCVHFLHCFSLDMLIILLLYCSNLEYITIPDSVVSIGYGVFDGCMDSQKFKIHHNTYIEQYCIDHGLEYVYSHDFDWLSE